MKKILGLSLLLGLASCGGGSSSPKTIIPSQVEAVGCTATTVTSPVAGVIIDCNGSQAFIPYGIIGQDGVDGQNGQNGQNGQDGQDGVDGLDGLDGQDGANGVSCIFEREEENKRVKIDCGGSITYVYDGLTPSVEETENTVENILLNLGKLISRYFEITSLYSVGAESALVTRTPEKVVIKEEFKYTTGTAYTTATSINAIKTFLINYYDNNGNSLKSEEFGTNTSPTSYKTRSEFFNPAGAWHNVNGPSVINHYSDGTSEDLYWHCNGVQHGWLTDIGTSSEGGNRTETAKQNYLADCGTEEGWNKTE